MSLKKPSNHRPNASVTGNEYCMMRAFLRLGDILAEIASGFDRGAGDEAHKLTETMLSEGHDQGDFVNNAEKSKAPSLGANQQPPAGGKGGKPGV
jgi:hypothetical protein